MTTREALEAALVATPDDIALHSAYADLLLEEGDPRGEYIRLQLAKEDRNQSRDKLLQYDQAMLELRLRHEQEWLGELWQFMQRPPSARSIAVPMESNVSVSWRRGWIDSIRIGQLSDSLVRTIAVNPFTRLLGSFAVIQNQQSMETRTAPYEMLVQVSLQPLVHTGRLTNLRHFELGSVEERAAAEGYAIDDAVQVMTSLESIKLCVDQFSESRLFDGDYSKIHTIDITYNNPRCRFHLLGMNDRLPNLRRLSLDTVAVMPDRGELGSEREPITPTDLSMFFRSKRLTALEYLTFRNGEFGDAGVEELLASGFIARLKGLDLCRCNITDAGAELLARHPHIRQLDYLHLDNNLLSPVGLDVLDAVLDTPISRNQMFGGVLAEDGFYDEMPPGVEGPV